MKYNNALKFLISIIICEAVGALGAIFTTPEIGGWYKTLRKPIINPPNWIFGPVWTVLFVLMGISLYIIWAKGGKNIKAVSVFGLQLALNLFWSILFFYFKSPGMAFVEIIFLWLAILWTIVEFYKLSRTAAFILLPYIIWVSFAALLNYSILMLN